MTNKRNWSPKQRVELLLRKSYRLSRSAAEAPSLLSWLKRVFQGRNLHQTTTKQTVETVTTATQPNITKSKMSFGTTEDWYWFWQLLSAVLIGGTVVCGVLTIRLGRKVSRLQSAQILALETNLEKQRRLTDVQREKAANAEIRLEELRKKQAPRAEQLRGGDFEKFLKGKVTGEAVILYAPDDMEAYEFSNALMFGLIVSGWKTTSPEPIPVNFVGSNLQGAPSGALQRIPLEARAGGGNPLTIISSNLPTLTDASTPAGVLVHALMAAGFPVGGTPNSSLPQNTVIMLIGKKQ